MPELVVFEDGSWDRLLTTADLCRYFRISKRTLWRWVGQGIIPAPVYIRPKAPRWFRPFADLLTPGLTHPTEIKRMDQRIKDFSDIKKLTSTQCDPHTPFTVPTATNHFA